MAEKKISYKDFSRREWVRDETGKYPGDEVIKLGCLMRIADLADMLTYSQREARDEAKMLRKLGDRAMDNNEKLRTQLSTLRGQMTRMKNKRAKAQKVGE